MFGPDNNHLIERLLMLALTNEEARQRLLTIQINNENYRTDLLLREHELVEQSAAHVAATTKAQERLEKVKLESARRDAIDPRTLRHASASGPFTGMKSPPDDQDYRLDPNDPEAVERAKHLRHHSAEQCAEHGEGCLGVRYWKHYDFEP